MQMTLGFCLLTTAVLTAIQAVEIINPPGQDSALDLPSSTGEANANVQALLKTPTGKEYENNDGCAPFADPDEFTGFIALLLETSACSFTVQATNAKNANALGLILANSQGNSLQTISTNVNLPTVFIGLNDFTRLIALLAQNTQAKVRISTFTNCFFDLPTVPCANSGSCAADST